MGRKRSDEKGAAALAETRGSIMRTAHDLFMKHGYRAVSTRQIADACGVTQPALYHHFKDKEALYVEVIESVMEKTKAALVELTSRHTGVEQRLIEVVTFILTGMPDDLYQMFRDIARELSPEARSRIQTGWMNAYLRPIAAVFEDGIGQGLLERPGEHAPDAMSSAFLLLSMIHRQAPAGARGPSGAAALTEKPAAERARLLVRTLLYGLASEQSRNKH